MGLLSSPRIAIPDQGRTYGLMCVNVTICVRANAGDGAGLAMLQRRPSVLSLR